MFEEELKTREIPVQKRDFYHKLRNRIKGWKSGKHSDNKWIEYVVLAPDLFHLLVKLSLDKDIPTKKKVKLAFAITYFASPIDLIPDFIPIVGLLDDIVVAAYVLNDLLNNVEPEVIQRNWAGEDDILELIKKLMNDADKMVGEGLYRRLVNLLKTKTDTKVPETN
ncbi:MAG: YkvA family protein [Candidatus Hatepunaea meridiana]|nr:YkvA family protein [Candidatus Hatepunaea meridiana]